MYGLYIHIPFCKSLCTYCDFPKRINQSEDVIWKYMHELIKELNSYKDYFNQIKTIYIGGGTPSCLSYNQLSFLFMNLKQISNIQEFTIECNPEDITIDKVFLFKQFNVNRVSIGVQTFKKETLSFLNRKHKKQDVIKAVNLLHENQISNINLDLMFGIPNTTLDDVKNDLQIVLNLPITHISYYSLILEEGTVLNNQYQKKKIVMIDNDTEADMYEYIISSLLNNGYIQYEISNFSLKGYESVHNQIYWKNEKYIGIGLGAAGYINNLRYSNVNKLKDYHFPYINEKKDLTIKEIISNEMILGLRLIKGINLKELEKKYQVNVFGIYPVIHQFIDNGLLVYHNDFLFFSRKGLMLSNQILLNFI